LPDRAIQKYHVPYHSRNEYRSYRKKLKAIGEPAYIHVNNRKSPLKAVHSNLTKRYGGGGGVRLRAFQPIPVSY
jgi:hypothetical protein